MVSGGCSMIPGFIERLEEEILELLAEPEFERLKSLEQFVGVKESFFPRNLLTWIGASIASTLPGLERYAITAEGYKEKGVNDILGNNYLYANRPSDSLKSPAKDKKDNFI